MRDKVTELVRWVGIVDGAALAVSFLAIVVFHAEWGGWMTLGVWAFLAMIVIVPLMNALTGEAPEPLFSVATRQADAQGQAIDEPYERPRVTNSKARRAA